MGLLLGTRWSAIGEFSIFLQLALDKRRRERLPTVHCDCVSDKMAEFSIARRVFTVFLCDIFTGLES